MSFFFRNVFGKEDLKICSSMFKNNARHIKAAKLAMITKLFYKICFTNIIFNYLIIIASNSRLKWNNSKIHAYSNILLFLFYL